MVISTALGGVKQARKRGQTKRAAPDSTALDAALARYRNASWDWQEIASVATGGYLTPAEFDLSNHILSEWRGAYKAVLAEAKKLEARGGNVSDHLPPPPPELKPFKFPFSAIDLTETAILLAVLDRNVERQTPSTIAEKYFTDAFDLLVLANDYVDLRPKNDETIARCHGITFGEIIESNKGKRIRFLPGILNPDSLKNVIRNYCKAVRQTPSLGHFTNGESYIPKGFLPVSMLAEIRAWRRNKKRKDAVRRVNSR